MELCLAIDVGATKMAAGLVTAHGDLVDQRRVLTPHSTDAEEVFAALAGIVGELTDAVSASDFQTITTCGIGCGGPMTGHGEAVSPLNIPAWRGFALRRRVAQLTGLPTAIDNDAKALALGEGWMGAGRHQNAFIAMVVSSGVGGGIVLDGRLLNGADGNAGHIGHVIVEPDGRLCPCGAQGCLEAEASGTSIAAITGKPAVEANADVVARTGMLVGRAVASVANLLDLELAVVGGSVALGFGTPFFDAANDEVERRCRLSFSKPTRVIPVGLGASGPLVGAAAVGWHAAGRTDEGNR